MFYQCTFITTHNIYKCNLPIKIYNTIQIMYFTNINARRPITYQLSQTTKMFSFAYFEGHFICNWRWLSDSVPEMHIIPPSQKSRLWKFKAWMSRLVTEDMHASLFSNMFKKLFSNSRWNRVLQHQLLLN